MTIDPKILEIIVCPQCRGDVKLENQALSCRKCLLDYPIRNGIPVLLIDAATKRG